jgi:hypothetical protein
MSVDQPRHIYDFSQLTSLLGNEFILLCGSAISGGVKADQYNFIPFLPMVDTASESFYKKLNYYLRKRGNYFDKILSKYSFELAEGKYKSGRKNRKFEDFLWRLEQILGVNEVVDLLRALYYCEPGQYLHNHVAIGNLLGQGRVKLCLTTNFDNAIESTNSNICKLVHVKGFSLNQVPTNPTILKLHGDVIEGNYIATIPQLLMAEKAGSYLYLEELLKNKTVLVAGYSGNGDIDIGPHLINAKSNGTRLIWLVKPKDSPPDMASDWFISDLFSTDSENNCLVALAGIKQNKKSMIVAPSWESRLENWSNSVLTSSNVKQIIDSSLDDVSGWAKVHIYFLDKWERKMIGESIDVDKDLIDYIRECQNVGTYHSALNALRSVNYEKVNQLGLLNEVLLWKGFTNWRLFRLVEASNTLRQFDREEEDQQLGQQEDIGLRVYLEVAREIIKSFKLRRDAYKYYSDNQIDKTCIKLLSIVENINNPQEVLFARLVILDIKRYIGENVTIEYYRDLYRRAFDLKLWPVARDIARSILRIDFRKGVFYLIQIYHKAGGALSYHSIKHNSIAILDKFPKILINPAYIANLFLSWLPVIVREGQFGFKRMKWKLAYKYSKQIIE